MIKKFQTFLFLPLAIILVATGFAAAQATTGSTNSTSTFFACLSRTGTLSKVTQVSAPTCARTST